MSAAFLTSLALTLFTLLDFRRGILFAAYPVRTLFYVFHPAHMPMAALGLLGLAVSYRAMRRNDQQAGGNVVTVKALTFTILALLVVDLFAYRGVPAARSMASGRINVDWLKAFGVTEWWKPLAQATSYLFNVWHATMLGILISGLALTTLPAFFRPHFSRQGFSGSMLGALFALPQPFCSCCSSVMAPSFARRGASTTFLLSFVVGAPMLNVTTIILAASLLPARFALLRIVAGVVVSVFVTYAVARVADRRPLVADTPVRSCDGSRSGFLGWFDVDRLAPARAPETPSQLIGAWAAASGRIALVLVPTLWVSSVVASALFQVLPSAFGNNLPSVVLSSIAGTFFMISTWSEIPMALALIQSGFDGPAAALLVVLPAVSLPCMLLLGASLRRFQLMAWLSAAVIGVGIAAGSIFL